MEGNCIFCDIVNNKLPADIIYENDHFILINDIRPDAKVHMLAIPKKHFDDCFSAKIKDFETIREILIFITKNAHHFGLKKGFRILINNGAQASQTVFHLHVQILGGQKLRHPVNHLNYCSE